MSDSPASTDQPRDREPIVGIDLGTTNSLVAIADEKGPRVLLDKSDRPILPSVVRFPPDDADPIVGDEAREHLVEFPTETVYSVKRLMGQSRDDVAEDLPYLSYEIVEGERKTSRIRIHERLYSPEQVSSLILARLKTVAEARLGRPVHQAVITVPAYFDDAQRQATRDAGRIAGLEVARIVNEPTAAALAYGLSRSREEETVAVYDLGGGTFDVSVLQLTPASEDGDGDDATAFFQVLSTAGDTHLGGDDVDRMIVELIQREVHEQFGRTLEFTPQTRQIMRKFAEAAKVRLSEADEAALSIDLGGNQTYQRTITRNEFDSMIGDWVERTIVSCRRALRDAKINPPDIGRVIMVGGSTRIPLVRERIGEFFGAEPYTALDPDQVVALGAAVQAGILSGTTPDALLLDVIPLSLGIETMGGAVSKLVMRNSTVPCRATELFSTSVDGQTSIKIHVLQGERELVRDCRSLGVFHLRGIPPMPAGIPQLEVTFHVDANGILNVSAIEKRSGKRAAIQIAPNYGLTREEAERMELESYEHAREDMAAHRVIDLRVNSALDVKWITERMEKLGDELEPEYRAELQQKIDELRSFIVRSEADPKSIDPNAFQQAKEALDRTSTHLHEVSIAASLREETTHDRT